LLAKYEHLVLFPVVPATSAAYRKAFRTSGAKDDPNDTALLLIYCATTDSSYGSCVCVDRTS
jgi:hypothetical protein